MHEGATPCGCLAIHTQTDNVRARKHGPAQESDSDEVQPCVAARAAIEPAQYSFPGA